MDIKLEDNKQFISNIPCILLAEEIFYYREISAEKVLQLTQMYHMELHTPVYFPEIKLENDHTSLSYFYEVSIGFFLFFFFSSFWFF